jgi:hypothetical protein
MVGQSTDIAKEIGDLQGKTAAIGVFALALKGEEGPRCIDRPDARACVRQRRHLPEHPAARVGAGRQDCGNLAPLRPNSAVGGGLTNL